MSEEPEDRVMPKNVDQAGRNQLDILLLSLTVPRTRRHMHMDIAEEEDILNPIQVILNTLQTVDVYHNTKLESKFRI